MIYWDTSALVAALTAETASRSAVAALRTDRQPATCALTVAEVLAALRRVEREHPDKASLVAAARLTFEHIWPGFLVHRVARLHEPDIRAVIKATGLRGADSVQLAIAARMDRYERMTTGARVPLATNDAAMWDAAQGLGLVLTLPRPG